MNRQDLITPESLHEDLRYLKLLSESFPTIAEAASEIINLEAIINLPKGTEHFLTDLHGEDQAFKHVLKNGSGSIKRKVNEIFSFTLRESERKELCALIYYPEQKLQLIKQTEIDFDDWSLITLTQLVRVCQTVASKYTRSKVLKSLPSEFSYIIQELLHESSAERNKQSYIEVIIKTIISTKQAEPFIVAMCNLIQRLTIDALHIVGDIFDRGDGAHIIMETLCNYHNFDIQWGNHDILWIGAAAGNTSCMANVIRMALRYNSLSTLEDGYGINLTPLATFAMDRYAKDKCVNFQPKVNEEENLSDKAIQLTAKMHKAITVIQLKLESQIVLRRPEFELNNRLVLGSIDYARGVYIIDGKEYEMIDSCLPTVDPNDPYKLTAEEESVVNKLYSSFIHNERLDKHIRCLFTHGSMYHVTNSNLLYHASIPLNEDGSFKKVNIYNEEVSGKALFDKLDQLIRSAYFKEEGNSEEALYAVDYLWYLWCGPSSPLFGKDKMTTFERYFILDKELHREKKGNYYLLCNDEKVCDKILKEFGIDTPHSRIINGHVPVKTIKGEQPIKANGKLLVIDGGFSRAYHRSTGIAGYTLVYHSRAMELVQHEPFLSSQKAIEEGLDIVSQSTLIEINTQRLMVKDTDRGRELIAQINDLHKLLAAYRTGVLKERK
ncbi:MAG: fructose-1,6-bisphosphatase [Rikenellaceae bacterium]